MPERHRRQPVNADVDVGCGLLAARYVQVAPARRAAAHIDSVVTLGQQTSQRLDPFATPKIDTQIQDVAGLFVNHRLGQAKARNLGADEATGLPVAIEHRDLVPQGCKVSRHRQGRGPGAHAGNAPSIRRCHGWHAALDVVFHIRSHPFEAADGHRLGFGHRAAGGVVVFFHPSAPAGGLARPVTGAPQHTWEHVGDPIDHVGVAVAALPDQSDVLWHGGVGGAGPLAIHDFMKIGRVAEVSRLQLRLLVTPKP